MTSNKKPRARLGVTTPVQPRVVRLPPPPRQPRPKRQVYHLHPTASASVKNQFKSKATGHTSGRRQRWGQLGVQVGVYFVAGSGLVFLVGGVGYLLSRLLVVDRTSCQVNQATACPVVVTTAVQNLVGQSLLFTNFRQELWQLRRRDFNFSAVSYRKQLSGQLAVNFTFPPPLYFLEVANGQQFAFDEFGHYTLAVELQNLPRILVQAPEVLVALTEYQLDPVLHQKIYDLLYLSREQWPTWSALTLVSLRQLEITTKQAHYLLDPFALDENLQKLNYLETSDFWADHSPGVVIDLRPNVPVLKSV